MSRNALHRDFNLCKAVVLAGLIGAAMLIGDMPGHERGETAAAPYDEVVLPASYRVHDTSQDVAGVALWQAFGGSNAHAGSLQNAMFHRVAGQPRRT